MHTAYGYSCCLHLLELILEGDRTMSDRHFYLAIAALVITAFMFRWELEPSSATDNNAGIHFKLDRFTGNSYLCALDCRKLEVRE